MTQIQSISDDAKQTFTLTLPNGETAQMGLEFSPLQLAWFMSIAYGASFVVNNMRVTRNQNILNQFVNLIPFGVACFTVEGEEPLFQASFSAGAAGLYLLDSADLASLEAFYGDKV